MNYVSSMYFVIQRGLLLYLSNGNTRILITQSTLVNACWNRFMSTYCTEICPCILHYWERFPKWVPSINGQFYIEIKTSLTWTTSSLNDWRFRVKEIQCLQFLRTSALFFKIILKVIYLIHESLLWSKQKVQHSLI